MTLFGEGTVPIILPHLNFAKKRGILMSMSSVLEDLKLDFRDTEEEGPKVAHYAESASVTEGYVLGTPVTAICGKIFIPSRDPDRLPLCSTCKEIAKALFLI